MVPEVDVIHRDGVAVLGLNRPIANALAPSLRSALDLALTSAVEDADVKAIVIKGVGQGFSSGVDISEYERPLEAPWVSDLCQSIEDAPKPVVAAMHGAALGAGFELALAAHARVADRAARVALPEVTLGLIPGAGGTQRLVRMTGAKVALQFLLSGRVVLAGDPKMRRVFEKLVNGDPLEDAIKLALNMAAAGTWIRTKDREPGLSDPEGYQAAVQAVASTVAEQDSAERDLVRCIEAAQLLPFEQSVQFERVLFQDRLASKPARAARHLFAAERRANAMPERSKGRVFPVQKVALLGRGPLAPELIIQCLDAGKIVMLVDGGDKATEAISNRVTSIYDAAVRRQRLDSAARDERLSRMTVEGVAEALQQADMVYDDGSLLVPEDTVTVKPNAVWASLNGELGDPSRSRAVRAEGRHVVLHHSRPAHSMSLVELAVPDGTSADAIATIVQSLVQSGKTVVRSALFPGLLRDNLFFALFGAALALCRAGVAPSDVDKAARALGFQKGPFETADTLGLPEAQSRHKALCDARSLKAPDALALLNARIAVGAKGRAVGRGIYLYEDGTIHSDPEFQDWLKAWWSEGEVDLPPKTDIGRSLHAALINEAAGLIDEKRVVRASDLDVVAAKGMGFDRQLGGPLLQADFAGILPLFQEMRNLAALDRDIWTPHPKIKDMVKYGQGFFGRAT